MSIILVNPCNEARRSAVPAPRLSTVANKAIALLDISKPGGDIFLDRLERILINRFGVARVIRQTKPTFAKPAPEELLDTLRHVDAVIEGLAD